MCGIYSQQSAGVSSTSLATNTTSDTESYTGSHEIQNVQAQTSRLVAKSSLSQRIAQARQKQSQLSSSQSSEQAVEALCPGQKDKHYTKELRFAWFLRKEEQWKRDACVDQNRRIANGLSGLGL